MSNMAYLNDEQQQSFNDPRISFSYGFADGGHQQAMTSSIKQEPIFREAVSSSSIDFEFTAPPVASFSINGCAEELFFQGKLVPSKENSKSNKISTLRDELLVDDDGSDDLIRGRKGSIWWKERFGFRKNSRSQNKGATIGFLNTAC